MSIRNEISPPHSALNHPHYHFFRCWYYLTALWNSSMFFWLIPSYLLAIIPHLGVACINSYYSFFRSRDLFFFFCLCVCLHCNQKKKPCNILFHDWTFFFFCFYQKDIHFGVPWYLKLLWCIWFEVSVSFLYSRPWRTEIEKLFSLSVIRSSVSSSSFWASSQWFLNYIS